MDRILIVRLGALGDIIHALPAAAALREAFPTARIDWLVSARHRAILDYVPVVDRRVVLERPHGEAGTAESAVTTTVPTTNWRGIAQAISDLRQADYDVAFDFQGLLKSAVLARSSGARRVVGFPAGHLRERWAHLFYSETVEPPAGVHVVDKNMALLAAVGVHDRPKRFPLDTPVSHASAFAAPPFALLNPGAGWPNKRWPPEWFGAIADHLRNRHGLSSLVLWGPGEEALARAVADASQGAASLAPRTGIAEMIALARNASLFVSGDTGPLHIAAATGTPIVGIYGPTSPARNGPWDARDICVSRFDACQCHHRRRCRLPSCCLLDISVEEVCRAIDERLAIAESPKSEVAGPTSEVASPASEGMLPDA